MMNGRDVFLCHVEEDRDVAEAIAGELESAGCSVWYYERDSVPGLSYLLQTRQAIDEAKCFLFLVSSSAIDRHHQVDKELVHAHEAGKHIIPMLRDTNFRIFRQARPDWHQAIGAVVGVELSAATMDTSIQRLLTGLRALGIAAAENTPGGERRATETAADSSCVVEDMDVEGDEDDVTLTVCDELDDVGEAEDRDYLPASIVHEHQATGFLADAIVTSDAGQPWPERLRVAFSHRLLKPDPYVVEFSLNANRDPLQYIRFPALVHGFPVVLRIHWLTRLPGWSTFGRTFGVTNVPAVRTAGHPDRVVNQDAAGILAKGQFHPVIAPGSRLPQIEKKRFRTTRDGQKTISVVPGVRTADGQAQQFPKLRLSVPAAPAGVAWLEFTFRVDPDGRYTVFARDPLHGMKIRDLIVVQ